MIALRLMYWQVYLHKTVLAAEYLLVKILHRARKLADKGIKLFCTPSLHEFLYNKYSVSDFERKPLLLDSFSRLDDFDIFTSVKVWSSHPDFVLSTLCSNLVNRHLFHTELQNKAFPDVQIEELRKKVAAKYKCKLSDAGNFVFSGKVENYAYSLRNAKINILLKDGTTLDIAEASDQLNISALTKTVTKYFLCYPKNI